MEPNDYRLTTESLGGRFSRARPTTRTFRLENLALERRQANQQKSRRARRSGVEDQAGVYIISVAARLLEMHPQTLRKYERLGLVRPSRTIGMLRLYSDEDLQKLRLIRYLETNLGMNLAGVEFTLNLLGSLLEMQRRVGLQARVQATQAIMEQEMKRLFEQLNLPFEEQV